MILIRLFPFVYADYIGNKILLYDTLQSSVMIEEFEGKVKLKNRINLLLFENPINNRLAQKIAIEKKGVVSRVSNSEQVYLSDGLSYLSDNFKNVLDTNKTDKVFSLVKRIFVSCTDSIDVFSHNMRKQYHVMDSQMFQNLKNKVGLFTSLQKLFVCIDELSFFNIKNILSEMEGHYEIFLLMSIEDYVKLEHSLEDLNCKCCVLVYESGWFVKQIEQIFNDTRVSVVDFLVKNEYELNNLTIAGISNNPKLKISFDLNACCEEKIRNMMCYSIQDILSMSVQCKEMIRNEWINFNYWGDLYINDKGDLMQNFNSVLGNLMDWSNVHLENLLSDESLWSMVRRKAKYCSRCLFRNVFPPVSYIEKVLDITFCEIFNDKNKYEN